MKKIIYLLLLISVSASAQNTLTFDKFFPFDKGHSYVEFQIKYMGYAKMKGRFADFSGMIYYDEKKPETMSVSIGIKTESIDTDLEFRDNDLKSDNWFDAVKYPMITFSSKQVKKTSSGFEMTGDLTMKGITKEIVLKLDPPVGVMKDVREDKQIIFTGTTSLDRTVFGVEGKNWSGVKEGITAVANEVTIEFSILGKQVQAPNWTNRVKNEQSPPGKIFKSIKESGVDKGIETFKTLKGSGEITDRNPMSTVAKMISLEGNVKEAIKLCEANREAFPQAPEVYYDLGEAYLLSGDMVKSKSNLQEAVKLNPNYFWPIEMLRHM